MSMETRKNTIRLKIFPVLRKLLFLVAALILFTRSSIAAESLAFVSAVEGRVEGMGPGKTEWTPLVPRANLFEDHKIRTQSSARAVISFNDGSVVKMNSLTTITLKSDPKMPEKTNVNVTSGELWVRARENGGIPKVSTPQALCGIRGTEFDIRVGETDSTLTVVFGMVEFSNNFGAVYVADSQQSSAAADRAPTPPRVVDPNRWIEWTLDLEAVGLMLEEPFYLDSPAALEAKLNALPQSGSDPAALLEIGKLALDLRRYEPASRALEGADEAEPKNPEILSALGKLKLLTGDRTRAKELFTRALELDQKSPGALRGLALVELVSRHYESALKTIGNGDSSDPLNATLKGLILLRTGDLKQAEAAFQSAVNSNPKCFQALQGLALLHLFENKSDTALNEALKSHEIYPFSSQGMALIARIQLYAGDGKAAESSAAGALELNPMEAAALDILSRIAVMKNDLDSALGNALRALASDETNPFAHDSLGRIYGLRLKYRAAENHYRKALEAYPDYLQARIDLVGLLVETKRFQAAEEEVNKGLERHPDDDQLVGLRGRIFMAAGLFDKARADFLRAVKLNPNRAAHFGNLALIAIEENDMRTALDAAGKAVNLEPGFPHYHEVLGVVYERIGNTQGAMNQYREALKNDPLWARARYRMGILLAREDKVRGAVAETSMAMLQDPRVMTFASYRGDAGVGVQTSKNLHEGAKLVWADSYQDTRLHARFSYISARPDGWRENADERRDTAAFYLAFRPDFRSAYFLMTDYMVLDQGRPYRADMETLTSIQNQPNGTASGLPANDPDDRLETLYRRVSAGYRQWMSPRHEILFRLSTTAGTRRTTYKNDNYYFAPDYVNPAARFDLFDDFRDAFHEYELRGNYNLGETKFSYGYNRVDSYIHERIQYWFYNINTGALLAAGSDYLPNKFRQWSVWGQVEQQVEPDLWVSLEGEQVKHNLVGTRDLWSGAADWKADADTWVHFLGRKQTRLSFYPQLMPRQDWAAVEDFDSITPGQESLLYEIDYEHKFRDWTFVKVAGFQRRLDTRNLGAAGFPLSRRTQKQGIQFTIERQLAANLNAFVQYTHAQEKVKTPGSIYSGNTASYSPSREGSLGLYYLPDRHLSISGRLRNIGSRYTSDANTTRLESITLGDVSLQYNLDLHLNFTLSITNVGDRKYEDPDGYPADRRRFTTLINLYF